MHAHGTLRPTTAPRRSLATAFKLIVAAELVVLVAGVALLAGPGNGGVPVDPRPTDPPAVDSPAPTGPASPTPAPTIPPSPTPDPTADPTRAPMPVPTTPPGTVAPNPTLPPVTGGPPTCAYLDVLTPHHRYGDWNLTLLDSIYRLPSSYAPGDLVDTSAAGLNGGYRVRGFIVEDLRELAEAARRAGAPIQVASGYRSYEQQRATFQHWVDVGGYEQALRTSARAGHSEHQLGTTLDVTSLGGLPPWEYGDWAKTPAGAFVARNSWRYGFVVSYPRGAFDRTCYDYEPWHLRYVGRERARQIVESGLTAREYLWTLQ
jgi:D-alanyl-D-alanine carboxypeptidase